MAIIITTTGEADEEVEIGGEVLGQEQIDVGGAGQQAPVQPGSGGPR